MNWPVLIAFIPHLSLQTVSPLIQPAFAASDCLMDDSNTTAIQDSDHPGKRRPYAKDVVSIAQPFRKI
jgi:hypothetical protein